MKYVCTVCGWEYDESVGYPEGGIAPGTPWSEVPEDFECPLCGVGKDSFEEASFLRGRRQATSDKARKRLRGERSPQPRSFWVWILSRVLSSCCPSCRFYLTALFSVNLR